MKTKNLVGAITLVLSSSVVAMQPQAYITNSGIAVTPMINAGYKYDDNIFSQPTDTKSSGILIVAPSVNFSVDDGINSHQVDINIESASFADSEDDDYVTGGLSYQTHLEPSSSSRFDISLGTNRGVEPRGTGITEGLGDAIDEPLLFDEQTAEITYEYGSLSSSARVAFDAGYYKKNYSNFESFTQSRNFDSSSIGSTFFYTTNSGTDAFVELKADAISYDVSEAISRDSDVFTASVGITWEATALTSGTLKIGQQQKKFTDPLRKDFDGLSWDASVQWQPLSYTTFSVNSSRNAKDPNVVGDYINESIYGVNWQHLWNEKLSTSLSYNFTDEDYSGVSRTDETTTISANLTYELRRWMDVSVYFDSTDRDSSTNNIAFDKSIVGISFTFSL